jgi:hypothetical protein
MKEVFLWFGFSQTKLIYSFEILISLTLFLIMIFLAKPRNMKDKTAIAIRKSVDDICDVCTCGGDTDDKCPDIIPGNLVGQLLPY